MGLFYTFCYFSIRRGLRVKYVMNEIFIFIVLLFCLVAVLYIYDYNDIKYK